MRVHCADTGVHCTNTTTEQAMDIPTSKIFKDQRYAIESIVGQMILMSSIVTTIRGTQGAMMPTGSAIACHLSALEKSGGCR
jgi:hypothetical protein